MKKDPVLTATVWQQTAAAMCCFVPLFKASPLFLMNFYATVSSYQAFWWDKRHSISADVGYDSTSTSNFMYHFATWTHWCCVKMQQGGGNYHNKTHCVTLIAGRHDWQLQLDADCRTVEVKVVSTSKQTDFQYQFYLPTVSPVQLWNYLCYWEQINE